jgi:hypothetical protein
MLPLSQQPPNSVLYTEPVTLKDAAADGGFDPPAGMTFQPKSCSSYIEDALGPMSSLDGWMQYGARNDGSHPDYFFQQVVNIPTGADLEKIRAAAMTCSLGFLTLESTLTGALTTTERTAPAVPGAESLALVQGTQFPQPRNAGEQALLGQIDYACDIGSELCPVCVAEVSFLASGNLLIITSDTTVGLADQLAAAMLSNARAVS